jgi:hypothetical protein
MKRGRGIFGFYTFMNNTKAAFSYLSTHFVVNSYNTTYIIYSRMSTSGHVVYPKRIFFFQKKTKKKEKKGFFFFIFFLKKKKVRKHKKKKKKGKKESKVT